RAQDAITAARPYAKRLGNVISTVAARAAAEADELLNAQLDQEGKVLELESRAPHPLLETRPVRRVELLVLTSDRGLCGGFNANIARRAERFILEERSRYESISLAIVGRKGREYFKRKGYPVVHQFAGVTSDIALSRAREVAAAIIGDYTAQN